MLRRIILILIVVVALAGVGVGTWFLWDRYGDEVSNTDDTLRASGTVEAEKAVVSSLISGRIRSINASEGAQVTSGTVLFALDDEILQLQVEQAQASVSAAQAALDQVRKDDGSAEEVRQAEARVEQATAALRMAQVQAGYASVTAPQPGTITEVIATVGENASPGRHLATIADLSALYVTVYVPETEIGRISVGGRAGVTAEGSDRRFDATITRIADEAEFTPSNIETEDQRVKLVYEVRLEIDNIADTLKPGMPVDVVF